MPHYHTHLPPAASPTHADTPQPPARRNPIRRAGRVPEGRPVPQISFPTSEAHEAIDQFLTGNDACDHLGNATAAP